MWPEEKKEMSEITLKEFNDLCKQAYEQRAEVKELDDKKKEANKLLTETKGKILAFLEENGLPNFRSNYGLVSTLHKSSAKVNNKEELYSYLKEKGLYDDLSSINSRTLNSFFAEEKEQAELKGDYNYELPGVEFITYTDLSLRKA